jgi:hypothetical protein
MIGQTKPRIRDRQHRLKLILAALVCATAMAAPPPPPPQPPAGSADAPDEEFIEFLGEDDVGDAAWWEFLKSTAPSAEDPARPPQEARQ